MTLVQLATLCSAIAFLSGIMAVGSGKHYQFSKKDILLGRRNAVLYVWVTFSSIFSLAHLAQLVNYGLERHWQYHNEENARWMLIHVGVAFLLTTAHLFIKRTLHDRKDVTGAELDYYLWGKRRVS